MLGMTKTDKPRDEPELCLGARGHLSASAAQAVLADAPDTIADVTFRHFRGEIVPPEFGS